MVEWGMNSPHIPRKARRNLRWLIGFLVAAGLAFAGLRTWRESRRWVDTDNAYLDGPVHSLAARLIGTVDEVLVRENDRVKHGQVLIQLDPRDTQTRREQNEAKLAEAKASFAAAEANVISAQANAQLSEVAVAKARLDLERMRRLVQGQRAAVAGQELDHAQAAYDAANASEGAAHSMVESAKAEVTVAQAKVASAAAVLKESVLQCEYTTITAPVDGRVGRRAVETGQPVIPAQPLLALVSDELWLTANFKETQITSIKPGQAVRIRFDAFPGRDWPGTVESLSPASGARFSLLPPDNATGNFTRIVQRLPVRIHVDESTRSELGPQLVPGLSAKVRVLIAP
jgi:membrane fusion protein (multidrug efflux system)